MDWTWFSGVLQGIFGTFLYDLLLAGVAAALLAYLKAKKETWAGPTLYGLAGFTMVMVIAIAFIGRPLLSKTQPETNPENIEDNIKAWSDDFSLGVQKQQSDDKFYFTYAISLPSGRTVMVGRAKQTGKYLNFQGNLTVAPEHEAILKNLSASQLEHFTDEINMEMARNKTGFALMSGQTRAIVVAKAVPITNNLNEDLFLNSLNEIDTSILVAREAVRLALEHIDALPQSVASKK